jgi:hypothetical protein
LTENPAIGQEGYAHILWLLNRAHWLREVKVDDKTWQAKFNLVVEMNKHGRGEFLQSGVFDSQDDWLNCLELCLQLIARLHKLANLFRKHVVQAATVTYSTRSQTLLFHILKTIFSKAAVKALQERSEITDLHFDHCSSPRMEGL